MALQPKSLWEKLTDNIFKTKINIYFFTIFHIAYNHYYHTVTYILMSKHCFMLHAFSL